VSPRAYSGREKALIALMVGVVSLFAIHRFAVIPYQTRLNELETLRARKERQLRRIRTIVASRKEIEAEYARRFNTRTNARSGPSEMGAFLKTIEKLARAHNVRVLDIRPTATQSALTSSAPSSQFTTESTWPPLASLLTSLEGQRVSAEKMTLTRSPQSPQIIKAQLHLAQE
jgi:hypothetical protein